MKELVGNINVLIDGIVKGQKAGAYSLDEAAKLLNSIAFVKKFFEEKTSETVAPVQSDEPVNVS